MRPIRILLGVLAWVVGVATPARGQDSARVVVQYVAGANVYLDGGTRARIMTGDTLTARKLPAGDAVGMLLVVTSTEERTVVAFLGTPFPLTRGDTLAVTIAHTVAPPPAVAAGVTPTFATPATPPRTVRTSSGSLALDLDLLHSKTTGVGSDPEVSTRTFTTPSVGLQYRNQGAPGSIEFRTSLRASQRSDGDGLVDPATLVQVYEATLVRRTARSAFQLGRFYSPYESFSGYWDGAMLHRGTDAFGVGLLAGFEPERGNSGFQSTEPKVGAVIHGRTSGRGVRYRTEFTVNAFFPKDAPVTHLMTGWSQALQLRSFLFSNSLQIDRETLTGHWVVTRLLTRVSTRLGDAGTVYAGFAIRQPYLDRTIPGVLPYRRDQLNGGFSYWSGTLGFAGDVSTSRQEGMTSQWAYSASASMRPRDPKKFGGALAATYWTDSETSGALLSPSVARRFGHADLSLAYQFYRSVVAGSSSLSHGIELGGRVPLAGRSQFSFRLRERLGGHLQSSGLSAGVWYPF